MLNVGTQALTADAPMFRMVRPFVDHPGARPPGAGTLPTLAAALTALGTYRARLTETGLAREFVEAGRLRSEGVEPRGFAAAVEPADLVELTRLRRGTPRARPRRGAVPRAWRARACCTCASAPPPTATERSSA